MPTDAAPPRTGAFRVGALLLALAGVAAAAPRLGDDLPPGSPSRATLAGWERIQGQVETAAAHVSYEFYIEPSRGALYTVTRYRRGLKGDGDGLRLESEKYVWNVGRNHRLRCFARTDDGGWRTLESDSDEYRAEMLTAMSIYGLHREATRAR
jgi:hypothetical protein